MRGYRVSRSAFGIRGLGFGIYGFGSKVQGLGVKTRVLGFGLRVEQGLGLRDEGLYGFEVIFWSLGLWG